MNRQVNQLGSQRKVSVSAPKLRERKPNLTFKAPTYRFRVSRNLSTRQGGSRYLAGAGLLLIFLVLTVNPVRKFGVKLLGNFSNGVKIFRERIIIDMLVYNLLLRILSLKQDGKGVYFIESENLHRFILPPE